MNTINKTNFNFSKRHLTAMIPLLAVAATQQSWGAYELEEIIITAQKRAENMQDVGVSVTAFTAEDFSKLDAKSAVEISRQVPNLEATNTFGRSNPVFSLRGIGLNDYNANNNPTVGVYVDEVIMVSNAMMSFQMFDLERVEVLKGPQGILFGRNTTGGAISFNTAKPSTEDFDAKIKIGMGRYDAYEAEGMVNIPISDNMAFRLSGQTRQQNDGFALNRVTGKNIGEMDTWSLRAQLAWENDSTSANLNIHSGRDRSDSLAYEHLGHSNSTVTEPPGDPANPLLSNANLDRCQSYLNGEADQTNCVDVVGYRDNDGDPYKVDHNISPIIHSDNKGLGLTISHDFDGFTLTSVTGYESLERTQTSDADASPFKIDDFNEDADIKQFSQEIRLTSNSEGDFGWLAGLYYLKDDIETDAFIDSIDDPRLLFSGGYPKKVDQETESTAIFAQVEWHLSDQLDLIAGVRATREVREYVGGTGYTLEHVGIPFSLQLSQTDVELDEGTELTYKLALEYSLSEEALLYLQTSKGVKSGGVTGGFAFSQEDLEPFSPEELFAYELGIKTRILDNSLQLNAAAFYYDYNDIQVFAVAANGRTNTLTNADKAEVYGVDLELWWEPIEGLSIKGGLGLLETALEEVPAIINDQSVVLDGLELANAPNWTFNLVASYEKELFEGIDGGASIDYRIQDDQYRDSFNSGHIEQKSYALTNARVFLSSQSELWRVEAWVKNLSDEHYNVYAFPVDAYRQTLVIPNTPRTYGLSLTLDF